ncbi:hypothetical protein GCM10023321_06630 [Pseudonocardia eucalypti]|uniref:Mce-associated membrane protein n=1 Tax=Pseudonocardia eucalypti TaxID=648755 RepID=A0ABP9PHR0_9PSEU|nr:hypothetical protein [Pseudonocardia eucalypti]
MTVQRRTPSDEHPTEVFRQIWDAEPGDPDEYFGDAVSAEDPGRPGPRPPAAAPATPAPAASEPAEGDGGDEWDWGHDEPEGNRYQREQPPAAHRETPAYPDDPGYLDGSDDRYLDEPDHTGYLDEPGRRVAGQPDHRGAHAEPADEPPAPAHHADAHQADTYQPDTYRSGPAHEADAFEADAYQADAYRAEPAHQADTYPADDYQGGPADHADAYPAGPAHRADSYQDEPEYQEDAYPEASEPAATDDRPSAEAEYATQIIDAVPDEPADAGAPLDSGGTSALPAQADSRGTSAFAAQPDPGTSALPAQPGTSALPAQSGTSALPSQSGTGALPAQPRSRDAGAASEGGAGDADETPARSGAPALPRRIPGRTTSGTDSAFGEQDERRGDVFPAPLRLPDLPPSLRAPSPEPADDDRPAGGVAEQLFGSPSGRAEQADTVIFDRVSHSSFGTGDRSEPADQASARTDDPDPAEPADRATDPAEPAGRANDRANDRAGDRAAGRRKRAEQAKRSTSRAASTSAAVGGDGATGAIASGSVAGAAVASGALGSGPATSGSATSSATSSTSGSATSSTSGSATSSVGGPATGSAGSGSAGGSGSASGKEIDEAERERRAEAALTETAAHPGPLVTDDDQADTDRDPDESDGGSDGPTARRAEGTAASFAARPPTADPADPTTQLRLPDFAASEQTALIDAAVDPDGPPGSGPRRTKSAARAEAKAAQPTEVIPAAVGDLPKPASPARKRPAAKKPETAKSETPPARAPVPLILVLLLVALAGAGGAYFCYTQGKVAEEKNQAQNVAYLDPVATSEVKRQITRAVEAIYSYDYTRLDQSEQLALAFITGSYSEEFKGKFQPVRLHGVPQKAALVSKVVEIGVKSVSAQNAELLVMVNQVGRSAASPQPLKATMRLSVTAQRADGQWKVSGVKTR